MCPVGEALNKNDRSNLESQAPTSNLEILRPEISKPATRP